MSSSVFRMAAISIMQEIAVHELWKMRSHMIMKNAWYFHDSVRDTESVLISGKYVNLF